MARLSSTNTRHRRRPPRTKSWIGPTAGSKLSRTRRGTTRRPMGTTGREAKWKLDYDGSGKLLSKGITEYQEDALAEQIHSEADASTFASAITDVFARELSPVCEAAREPVPRSGMCLTAAVLKGSCQPSVKRSRVKSRFRGGRPFAFKGGPSSISRSISQCPGRVVEGQSMEPVIASGNPVTRQRAGDNRSGCHAARASRRSSQ